MKTYEETRDELARIMEACPDTAEGYLEHDNKAGQESYRVAWYDYKSKIEILKWVLELPE